MNLLMSDRPLPGVCLTDSEDHYVDLSQLNIANCIGCFGCWVKTPGSCVIRDDAPSVYPLIARSRNLIYVSRIRFGSYDTVMKTMLERAIPIQQAFIRLYNGQTHHVQRAVAAKNAVIIAYGCKSKAEQNVFMQLVRRNADNMMFLRYRIIFASESELETIVTREVAAWASS